MLLPLFILGLVASGWCQQCNNNNCEPPDCRCFDGDEPGDFDRADIPQMVLVTLGYELNSEYGDLYKSLFTVRNPNDCPVTGTIFVQDVGSDYNLAKDFYDNKFEIGIQSPQGEKPTEQKDWDDAIKKVKDSLVGAGINEDDIRGFKANALNPGGLLEYTAMGTNKLVYSVDCVTTQFDTKSTYKFPYTFDFPDTDNSCNTGELPTEVFKGKWGISIPALTYKGTKCATAAGCAAVVTTKQDAFDILYNNFNEHYDGNRAPFVVEIDPVWVKNQDYLDGTIEFLEYVRAAFDDTWIINAWQAVEWVRNPTPTSNITNFDPWKCD
ncbi:hypothetical protein FSP39_000477 [Pinctada imbricata]|uniref:Uncharacterized protein n=1 Tax=Pinctada imbricata TaxID=66713 RepID=A0AA89C5B7_PINIB|nr:hypothetical protein FSP39_000477 [Pinctada imbricata]